MLFENPTHETIIKELESFNTTVRITVRPSDIHASFLKDFFLKYPQYIYYISELQMGFHGTSLLMDIKYLQMKLLKLDGL